MKVDVNTGDLFHEALGETRDGGCPSLCEGGRALIVGGKKWGQKSCSTIPRAMAMRVMIAPQQILRYLNPS